MKTVTLPHGAQMPLLGFGVYQIPAEQTQAAVEQAIELGYRHLDTAAAYRNEEAVGAAIRASGVPRKELFLTTKLWIQKPPAQENALRAAHRSLERLGVDYVDLYLMHQPLGDVFAHWRAMQALLREGNTREIGVSNLSFDRLIDLTLHHEVAPAVNQIEVNPFHQQTTHVEALQVEGVVAEAWAPFAEGRNGLFTDALLAEIAREHDASVGQVVLAWLAHREVVALAKSVRPDRMAENLASTELVLTQENMARIATLDTGVSQFFDHRDPEMVRWLDGRAEEP